MKIMFLSHLLAGGGAEKVLANLSLFLPEEYIKKIVLFEDVVGYEHAGEVIVLNEPASNNFYSKLKTLQRRIFKLKELVKKEKPDIVISFLEGPNILNLLTPGSYKKVLTIHNYLNFEQHLNHKFIYKLIKTVIKLIYNKADNIIAVSQGIKKDLIQQYGIAEEKISVIYNPIDIKSIKHKAVDEVTDSLFFEATKKQEPIIITIGRLSVEKNHKSLINAFNKIKNQTNAKLFVVGKGPLEQKIIYEINAMGLNDRVFLLGWQDNPYKFLAQADFFVLSSLWEGFPVILEEAMALGKPIISYNCPHGPKEILDNGKYGILVPERDEAKLAEEMLKLLKDKQALKKYSTLSKDRAQLFDREVIMKQYVELFERLVKS